MKKRVYIIRMFVVLILSTSQRVVSGQTDFTNKGVAITNLSDIYINGNYIHDSTSKIANGGTIYFRKNIINTSDNRMFITDAGKAVFDGEEEQIITGDSVIQFNKLELNKTATNLILFQSIVVKDSLHLIQGNIDLNGKDIDLSENGELINETDTKKIFGASGKIKAKRYLDHPRLTDNIGGLGLYLSANENFSYVHIERGHEQQISNGDLSMKRYFNFIPDNSSFKGLIDSLKISYFNSENVTGEHLYKIFASANDSDWKNKGGLIDTLNNVIVTTTFTPPEIGKFKAAIFPIESFATCAPNDPSYISAVFLVSTDVFNGDSVKFIQLTSPDPANYSWNFGDGIVSADHSPFHIYNLQNPSISQEYQVAMTVSNGICSDTRKKNITVNPETVVPKLTNLFSGIEYFNIYPNPNTGRFNLEVKTTDESDIHLFIFDLQGRLMDKKSIRSANHSEELNIEQMSSGIYYVKLQVGAELRIVKIIKL